jgi:hypothetical protein
VKYNGALDISNISSLLAALNTPSNWSTSNDTAFSLSNNSLFPV